MLRRDDPAFVVFGVLTLEDRDLRELPLIERKKILSRLIPKRSSFILFADHIERRDVIFIDSSAPATPREDEADVIQRYVRPDEAPRAYRDL